MRTKTRSGRRPAGENASGKYHHGALRQALLTAAASLLADVGVERFTLRECARRAGVSHGAPAHHFGDVRGLLSELAADSFEQLATLMRQQRDAADPDPFSQFEATGLAYLEFALANPAPFRLMFRSERLDASNSRLVAAGQATYGQLANTIAGANATNANRAFMLPQKAALAWSVVHGFANLMLDNEQFADNNGRVPESARSALKQLIRLARPAFEAERIDR
jgi:AcrR family transcriptional regulator